MAEGNVNLAVCCFHVKAQDKKIINWIKIVPYAPSQGGALESMVKLFKTALYKVMDSARRLPNLIELQTYTLKAVRIVNDRSLTTPRDQP